MAGSNFFHIDSSSPSSSSKPMSSASLNVIVSARLASKKSGEKTMPPLVMGKKRFTFPASAFSGSRYRASTWKRPNEVSAWRP